MNKIFCITGKSSSGKDTILNYMQDFNKENHILPVISYTTRPMRTNEKDGVDYHFVTDDDISTFEKEGKIIEKRIYHTIKGDWTYATVDDNYIDLNRSSYICIIDLDGYQEFIKYFGPENVIGIYVTLDDGERLSRALNRERKQKNPNYEELCRRYLADNQDFSLDKINALKLSIYTNSNLEDCVHMIESDIKKVITN